MPSLSGAETKANGFFQSRSQLVGLGVSSALLFALGFLPQFGGPGYEASLAAGVIMPTAAAMATAVDVSGMPRAPIAAFARGLTSGAAIAFSGLLLLWIHGLRVGFCDAPWGTWLYLLSAGFGALMGGVWGSVVGVWTSRFSARFRALLSTFLAMLGPVTGMFISLLRFYTSPMVFAFDPFFGYFSGPLYDTVIDPLGSLLTYRAGSLFSLGALAVLLYHLDASLLGRVRVRHRGHPVLICVGVASALASFAITLSGPELGHYSTTRSIERTLGRSLSEGRCDVVYASAIIERDARLVGRDCAQHLHQIEQFFGVRGPERIKVFLFASDAEKGRLMGASNTYIAKPWRAEVYLQASLFPHPVLRHELAHVVAGSFGSGPFKVAGPLGGLIPDPGRIEGVAVAAAPNDNDDFSQQEWTRAMMELGLLPPLTSVFKLSFLGQNASAAYTVAGAFVAWFHGRYGKEAVRRWYGGAALEHVTGGKDLATLEGEWHAALRAIVVDPALLNTARVRFDRPALFGRRCPRIVDRLYGMAHAQLGVPDPKGARKKFEAVLELDPTHVGARFGLAACALRSGSERDALAGYTELASSKELARLEQANAREAIGDIHLLLGKVEEARAAYDAIATVVSDEDRLRTLDVKRLPTTELERSAIVALLIGDPTLGSSWDVAAPKLAEWAQVDPEQGTAEYLLGKNLYGRGRFREAAAYLDRALAKRLELPRIYREALRTRLVVACALNDHAAGSHTLDQLFAAEGLSPWRRAGISRFAERCGFVTTNLKAPSP